MQKQYLEREAVFSQFHAHHDRTICTVTCGAHTSFRFVLCFHCIVSFLFRAFSFRATVNFFGPDCIYKMKFPFRLCCTVNGPKTVK